jgi:hypothetical protein
MGTVGTNDGYSITVGYESAYWSGRTLFYTAYLNLSAGAIYYQNLTSNGSLSGPGATTATIVNGKTNSSQRGTVRMMTISGSIAANAAGDAVGTVSGTFGTQYPFYVIFNGRSTQIGVNSVSASEVGSWHISTPPNTPTFIEITRNSLTNFYIRYNQTGGGPAVTYYVERARNAAMTDTFETTSANPAATGFNWTVAANVTYYFRIRAQNADGTTYSSVWGPYYGQPSAPRSPTASRSITRSGSGTVSWLKPTNAQGGIQHYHVYRNGTYLAQVAEPQTGETVSYTDTTMTPGVSYTYYVLALGASYWSDQSSTTSPAIIGPGAPAAPTLPANYVTGGITYPNPINFGRDVTITCNVSPNDFGIPIVTSNAQQGYFVQYRFSDEAAGTYSAWSTPVKMSNQTNRVHTFPLLDAAKWYRFRIYAANTIVNNAAGTKTFYPHNSGSSANFSVETTALFVPAAGKRFDAEVNDFVITNNAKIYNAATNRWENIATAKRYDQVQRKWDNLT